MNKLTQGSNMIWESSRMIMPQHKEAAVRQQREELRKQRMQLDNQEKEQIARFIQQAHKTRRAVKLRMYDPFNEVYVNGIIEQLDGITARLRIDGKWFYMKDIISPCYDEFYD